MDGQDKLEEGNIQPHPTCWSEEMMMIILVTARRKRKFTSNQLTMCE